MPSEKLQELRLVMRQRILRGLFIAMLIVGGNGIVGAGPLDDGYNAVDRGDYTTALRIWRPLADQGNAEAQYNLGVRPAAG